MNADSSSLPDAPPEGELHPTFLNARREARLIVVVWAACLVWAVPYCYLNGYVTSGQGFDPGNLATLWGIPRWVCIGIVVPWTLANVFTIWFCFFYMRDDDLGEAHEGADLEQEIAEMHAGEKSK